MSLPRVGQRVSHAVGAIPIYDKPKVAALDYTQTTDSTRRDLLAKYAIAVVNFSNVKITNGGSIGTGRQLMLDVKAINPNIKFAQYTILSQMYATNSDHTGQWTAINAGGTSGGSWWTKDAGTGNKTQYSPADVLFPDVYEVNQTNYTTPDASGKRWPQKCADTYYTAKLADLYGSGVLDYVFNDNTFARPRAAAGLAANTAGDINLDGTNDLITNATIQSEYRAGYPRYWDALRALMPNVGVMPNTEVYSLNSNYPSIAYSELTGKAEAAFLEGVVSKNYSPDTYAGMTGVMNFYYGAIANVIAGGPVLFHASSDSVRQAEAQQPLGRYGLTLCMLNEGFYTFTDQPNGGSHVPFWLDEFDQNIGAGAESPPVAAWSNGVWKRAYTNGIVLSNPLPNGGKHLETIRTSVILERIDASTVEMRGYTHGRTTGDVIRIMGNRSKPSFNIVGASVTVVDSTTMRWSQSGTSGEIDQYNNPGGATGPLGWFGVRATVDLTGQGYKRFLGTQDSTHNDGSTVTTVDLYSADGILLIKA